MFYTTIDEVIDDGRFEENEHFETENGSVRIVEIYDILDTGDIDYDNITKDTEIQVLLNERVKVLMPVKEFLDLNLIK